MAPGIPRRLLAGAFSLVSAGLLAAQSPRPIELPDYYRLVSVGSPAISPDGRLVAFIRTRIVEAENRRHGELWLAATDGSAPPMRIANPAWSVSSPGWSPDGGLLSFRSVRRGPGTAGAGEGPIWFLDMQQPRGEAFQVEGVSEAPLWSPDGRWIAQVLPVRAPRPPAAAGPGDTLLARRFTGRIVDWMNYRFDGRGYLPDPRDSLATPARELYLVPRAGGRPRRITSLGVTVGSPAWSPDGSRLAFVADLGQRDEHNYGRADLFTVTVDGQLTRLTDDGFDHAAPAWSPDGGTLVFLREEGLNRVIARRQPFGAPTDLFAMPAAGGPMRNLTAGWDLIPGAPRIDAGGAVAWFEAGTGGATHLFRVPLEGGTVTQVTRGDRRLSEFDAAAREARMVYVGASTERPGELFAAAADGSGERRLTGFNDALVQEVAPRAAERLWFPSRDGTRIEGWLLLPAGYVEAGPPVPMILAMHGGPHSAYGYDFSFPFQLWAARGYAVLYLNPRGSTGYGEKFLWATWGGWGVLDYQDVMAGVEQVLARYRVDPKRLGVTGYSYGGFLTDWIITQTDRFAAAVAGAGISNWLSDYGTADIPRTKESEFFGAPWQEESGALLWKLSPVAHAAAVRTPTLFLHGEADLRVPIEQAEQMYTALSKLKVPARLVRYPDMYHTGWTPWNTVHRYQQELDWWQRWLRQAGPP